jgi:hypothetical protein
MQPAHAKKIVGRQRVKLSKTKARSRITNGMALLPDVDGRSLWARRMRDLIALHVRDAGGEDLLSEAQRSIIRRAACITVELERLEQSFANGDANVAMLAEYGRGSNTLRRLLESLGLERKPRDITPSIMEYARQRREIEP